MARKNIGSMSPIMRSAAPVFPIALRVNMYVGMPMAAAVPKHMSCLLLMLNASRLLIRLRSFGTLTNAIQIRKENFCRFCLFP